MSNCQEEMMEIFKELSPENQANLLMCSRLAYIAECAVRKSLDCALKQQSEKKPEK